MFELLSMMRLHNCLMAALATFIGGFVITGFDLSNATFLWFAMTAAFW